MTAESVSPYESRLFEKTRLIRERLARQHKEVAVDLRAWFPPADPLGEKVAAAAIVREDLLRTQRGLVDSIKLPDLVEDFAEKTYWIRRTIASIGDAVNVLERLGQHPGSFKRIAPGRDWAEFVRLNAQIRSEYTAHVKDHRDRLGGHVAQILLGLEKWVPDEPVKLRVAEKAHRTRHFYAAELSIVAMQPTADPPSAPPPLKEWFRLLIRVVKNLSRCSFATLDWVIFAYAANKGLLPLSD